VGVAERVAVVVVVVEDKSIFERACCSLAALF